MTAVRRKTDEEMGDRKQLKGKGRLECFIYHILLERSNEDQRDI